MIKYHESVQVETSVIEYDMAHLDALWHCSEDLGTSEHDRDPLMLIPSTGFQITGELSDTDDIGTQASFLTHTEEQTLADPLAFAVTCTSRNLRFRDGFFWDRICRIACDRVRE